MIRKTIIDKRFIRGIAILICFCIFAGGTLPFLYADAKITACTGVMEEDTALIYAYRPYSISLRNAIYDDCNDDGNIITDTEYSSITYNSKGVYHDGWLAFKSFNGSADFTITITIDLEYEANLINLFFARVFHCGEIGASAPTEIKYSISSDGKSFDLLGYGTTTTKLSTTGSASAVYRYECPTPVSGRYLQAVFQCKGTTKFYINEFGVGATGLVFQSNNANTESFNDNQGVVYKKSGNSVAVTGILSSGGYKGGSIQACTASFNQDDLTYILGEGSDNEVKVISDFISPTNINYSGVPNNIRYIVIHNTGTTEAETDAERYNKNMHNMKEEKSWHYTVDSEIIYHSLSDNIVGWHSGSTHNYQSIGIEICTNGAPTTSSGGFVFSGTDYNNWVKNTFRPAIKNAAMLTAELLTRYGLGLDAVIQHYDVTEKNCPLWMRYKDGKYTHEGTLWVEFMGYVEEYYLLLNGTSPNGNVTLTKYITIPDYVKTGGKFYPITSIKKRAFEKRKSLIKSISLGVNISDIDFDAFNGCSKLSVNIDRNNAHYHSDENGILYNYHNTILYDRDTAETSIPSPKEGCTFDIREIEGIYYLFIERDAYTLADIAREYGTNDYSGKSLNGAILSPADSVSTGTLLNLGGAKIYLVAAGDMDGDASLDIFDYVLLKLAIFDTYQPSKAQLLSVSVSGENDLSIFDYLALKSSILKSFKE